MSGLFFNLVGLKKLAHKFIKFELILGGSISGDVYLANYDNYVNTNSSYPTFTVTPSDYHFKRKLVKTTIYLPCNFV